MINFKSNPNELWHSRGLKLSACDNTRMDLEPVSCKLAATHTHRIFRHPSMHAYTLLAKRTQVHAVFIIEADVTVVIGTLERRKRQPHEFNASWNGARERGDTEPAFVF